VSSALETITDYITDGRTLIQDTVVPNRYDDTSMVAAMNATLLEARRLRADLFVYCKLLTGQSGVQFFQANDGTKVLIEEPFRLGIFYGMLAQTLMRDEEDIQDARAAQFMAIFNNTLLGVRSTAPATPGS
jgi:hypothetical protein